LPEQKLDTLLNVHMQDSGPSSPDPWTFKPEISRLRQTVKDYYCTKFQVIPIRSYRCIVLTYTHTDRDKVIAISAPTT